VRQRDHHIAWERAATGTRTSLIDIVIHLSNIFLWIVRNANFALTMDHCGVGYLLEPPCVRAFILIRTMILLNFACTNAEIKHGDEFVFWSVVAVSVPPKTMPCVFKLHICAMSTTDGWWHLTPYSYLPSKIISQKMYVTIWMIHHTLTKLLIYVYFFKCAHCHDVNHTHVQLMHNFC
jgi:hypothetical protein